MLLNSKNTIGILSGAVAVCMAAGAAATASTNVISAPLASAPAGLDPSYAYESKPSTMTGTWVGFAEQNGAPPYKMIMTITYIGGSWAGIVSYPDYKCRAEVRSTSEQRGPNALSFTETKSEGPCMPGGKITLRIPSGPRAKGFANWEWRTADNQYVATAKLYKRIEGEQPATSQAVIAVAPTPETSAPEEKKTRHQSFTDHMNGLDVIRFESGAYPGMSYPTGSDLMRAATWLAQNKDAKLRIEGRVDKTETRDPSSAKELSGLRLDLVENFLWARGVPEANIERVNLGLDNPYGLDRSVDSRVKNRSVRILILN